MDAFTKRIGRVDVVWSFVLVDSFLDFVAKGGVIELNEEESAFMGRPIKVGDFTFWRLPDFLTDQLATIAGDALAAATKRGQVPGFQYAADLLADLTSMAGPRPSSERKKARAS